MEQNEINVELFGEPSLKFKHHLEIAGNERIIFSGKFGHGKTTFLQAFFNKENQKKIFSENRYNIISLFPVNYSIATNEDIFKYIKYDIIFDMLEKDYKVKRFSLMKSKLFSSI